ncbi:WD40/YVTN/BNR-like repeat-containing protein [Candidatus Palauibacter sp.]|uniref:WD40/YVTN/BNR-like repeat-containing protein n=1 Tax=Candidatus Palauibacter sp. TaxID=3101350 RepID=UPI003B5C109C
MNRTPRHLVYLLAPFIFLSSSDPGPLRAQDVASAAVTLDSAFLAGYRWRNLGPDRGGRSIAVSGVVGRPQEGYFGATGGGLWKTTDGGENWGPVTDFKIGSASVGAVAVSETDPDLVFIGTGETCIRGNIMPGDGVYRSRDGGETWEHVGFSESHGIAKIRIHPTDPNIVYVASFGKYGAPSEERGLYRSTDGGDSWERVLFRDERTGAVDIALDRNDPDVIYAALWEAFRKEYTMSSGGPGSGMFKSTDGGETWTEITRNPGMPEEGVVGRIGLAVSSANSGRVFALFEHADGGLFRSEDGGETWALVNDERRIRQRAFYYTHVFADHHDPDVVYVQNTSLFHSTDGGETYEVINNGTHGDFHDFWISPEDPAHLIVANDGGGAVSFDTGQRWTDQEFSTAQFYHGVTTAHVPFHVCGSQQDNSTLCLPSAWNASRLGLGQAPGFGGGQPASITEGSMEVAYRAGGGEPGYIAPDPKDLDVFFSGTNNGRYIDRFNRRLGISREVNPYPWFYSGEPASEMVERWQWTFPIIFSPLDPNVLYVSSNRLWKTTNAGDDWEAISHDLTRADPMTLGHSGGPITGDMNGPEVYATIFSVGPGKVDIDVIWTGSDDGLVHVTRDGGETWTDVTPPDMPEFGRVSQIDASVFEAGRAYVSVRKPLLNDLSPYVWKTDDYGATWTKIVHGIRGDAYVHAVREDPSRAGLLYAGTQHGMYVSYDDGANWQELNPGFPDIPVSDVIVEHNELAIASHGRGFWVLDNLAPLRQARGGMTGEAVVLFDPATAYRSANGATLSWWLGDTPEEARLEILDASGVVLRTYEPAPRPDPAAEGDSAAAEGAESTPPARDRWAGPAMPAAAGLNMLQWDLRTDPAATFPGMILWGVRTMAPTVPPGMYTVRLTADGEVRTTEVEVARHPWIEGVTDADLQEQFEFGMRIRARVDEANSAVIAIRRVKAQLDDRLEASDDAALADAAGALTAAASEVEGNIYQVRNRSNQDPLNFPIRVNNRLANLLSMSERGDGRPGSGMYEVFEIMVAELEGYAGRLQEVWANELAAMNRELERLGLEAVDPADETVELVS